MQRNWVAPHDLTFENPAAGDVWDDIDFGGTAASAGWRGGGPPRWVNIGNGADPSVVDWQEYLALNGLTDDFVLGIAVTYVENTTGAPLPVGICTASDDSILVYVNDRAVTAVSRCRGVGPDCSELNPAVLAPGANRITVLVWEGHSGFGFRLALTRPDGSKYTAADPEIAVLGADNAPPAQSPPALVRSYPGSDFLLPGADHTVTLRGEGGFDPGTLYTVREEIRGSGVRAGLSGVSHGGKVADLTLGSAEPVGDFADHRIVGPGPCGPGSDTTFDGEVYTSIAETGGDIWNDGDLFEFAYSRVRGDFDISIGFTDRAHSTGLGRWGKFGLMARWTLDWNSRFTSIQDHLPDLGDPARLAGRTTHLVGPPTGGMYEDVVPAVLASPHPLCLRLTRRGNIVEGWVSDDPLLLDGTLDPTDDANWVQVGRSDNWGDDAPEAVFVGFANSEHNSEGCAVQTVSFRLLHFGGEKVSVEVPIGAAITWEVPGSILDGEGLEYTTSGAPGTVASVFGYVSTGGITAGPDRFYYQEAAGGPIGPFDGHTDIGLGGPCTAGSLVDEGGGAYTMTASGLDIWAGGDQFHFAYTRLSGDFTIQARFTEHVPAPAGSRWGKVGLMARWDATPESAYYFIHNAAATNTSCEIDAVRDAFRPQSGRPDGNGEPVWLWWQDIFGDERIDEAACVPPVPYIRNNDARGDERNLAPWLRMVRRGGTFYSYASDDGERWTTVGSYSWPDAPETLLVGVAMTSHADCEVQSVTFDNISIDAPEPLAPRTPPEASLAELRALAFKEIFADDFDTAPDFAAPPGWITHKWGGPVPGFQPQAIAGRFRLADLRNSPYGSGEDTGTSAFRPEPIPADGTYLADFDVYFAYDDALTGPGENAPADGLTFAVLGLSDPPRREHTPPEPVSEIGAGGEPLDFPLRTTVGTARRSDNLTVFNDGVYTTRSSTGRDLWVDGDSFEFAYRPIEGDFDVAIEILDRRFPPQGRWGKFGLMARQSLDHHAKHASIQDHGPDLQDPARFARRFGHRRVWSMEEPAIAAGVFGIDPNDGTSLAHPRFMRLTRRGNDITGWLSNTAGDLNPADDANWVALFTDDTWSGVPRAYVGFAYGTHNSSADGTGEIDWRVVSFEGTPAEIEEEPPVPHALDVRFGERGGGLAWQRIHQSQHAGESVVRSRDIARASFAVEIDAWHGDEIENDGDGGNVSGWDPFGGAAGTGTGAYHMGIDVAGTMYTAQRNHQFGIHDDDLPDIYDPEGVHVTVLYDRGLVRVWAGSNAERADGNGLMEVLRYAIEPLTVNAGEAIFGFTAATGGATATMEIDNFVLRALETAPRERFVRGDADANDQVQLTDAIRILSFLFQGGRALECADAGDSDDNGALEITDAIRILQWLFVSPALLPLPPSPSAADYDRADCGPDPTPDDELSCATPPGKCR